MRYYLDTEFYERPNTIDLISIALVAEDGGELYLENVDFDWSRLHRLAALVPEAAGDTPRWLIENVKPHLEGDRRSVHLSSMGSRIDDFIVVSNPEFWGYYCDYDWVVFCWLFGRMIDLPPHFPKYCFDLKQEMKRLGLQRDDLPPQTKDEHNAIADARWIRDAHTLILRSEDYNGRLLP